MMDDFNVAIEQSFEETLCGELDSFNQSMLESSFDIFTSDSPINDIPVVKTLIGLCKTGVAVRERIFSRKLISFLIISKDTSIKERQQFIDKIESDKKYRVKVGETYMSLIEKARDTENAEQIAYLSNACIKGKISYDDFLRCVNTLLAISSGSIRDFVTLKEVPEESLDELIYSGIYRLEISPTSVSVKDDEQVAAEEKNKNKEQRNPYNINFGMPVLQLSELLEKTKESYEKFSSDRMPEKYHVKTEGGEISLQVSRIGRIIKEYLKDYYTDR